MRYFLSLVIVLILGSHSVNAQDTIVLKTGQKIYAKQVHIRNKVYFKYYKVNPPKYDSLEKSEIAYIVRHSGWKVPMVPAPWYAPIIISPGVGLSTMPFLFRSFLGDTGSNVKSYSPVYNLNIDYASNAAFSLGVGVAWQSVKLNPYVSYISASTSASFNPLFPNVNIHGLPTLSYPSSIPGVPTGGPDNNVVESLTRFNTGVRLLYHIRNDDEEDFYIGARVGISFWTDQSTPSGFTSLSTLVNVSLQGLIGIRKELSDLFGLNFEAGIGTPYQVNAGIYYKVNTKKK